MSKSKEKVYNFMGNLDTERYTVKASSRKEAYKTLHQLLKSKVDKNSTTFVNRYIMQCLGVIVTTPVDSSPE